MKLETTINHQSYAIKTNEGICISIPLTSGKNNPKAFYAPDPKIEAVMANEFIGDTQQGGILNFKNVFYNPHGNGTHTECVGHIAKEFITLSACLTEYLFVASLITVVPANTNGDKIITKELLEKAEIDKNATALIIRTTPNDDVKKTKDWSGTNPPYIHHEAMAFLVSVGIDHFLIDVPSVDRENDEGKLLAHKTFWNYPSENVRKHATITEMIYAPNEIADGIYLLNIQVAPIALDACSSNIIIYPLQ